MKRNSATDKASPDPTYEVSRGETITAWIVSGLIRADFPGVAAPAEDRVDYRFINGFVDVGDLPCRKAFRAGMVGRAIEPEGDWPAAHLNLPGANRRVEFTGFWHVPTHIRRWLKGTFRSEAPRRLHLRLRTCGGVRIWVNGSEQVRFEPFRRNVESTSDVRLDLAAGDNHILLHTEDLAERDTPDPINLKAVRESADRKAIRHALARAEGNISNTAKLLGISRPTLYDLLKNYDLHA